MIWNRFSISAAIFSATGRMVSHQNSDAKNSQIVSVSASKRESALEFAVSPDSTFTKDSGRSLAVLCRAGSIPFALLLPPSILSASAVFYPRIA